MRYSTRYWDDVLTEGLGKIFASESVFIEQVFIEQYYYY